MAQSQTQKRPLIGIFPSRSDGANRIKLSWNYLDAVYHAGGMGVPLGYTTDEEKIKTYVDMMDGFLFSGGVDFDPAFYGEEKMFDSVEIDELRDAFEKTAFPYVLASGKPILGICRGIQAINVLMGGSLYQHMEGHRQEASGVHRTQPLTVLPNTYFHTLTGKDRIMVNTFHHQNVKALADGLVAQAVSEDGFIEAIHAPAHKFLFGVQFHPEFYHDQPDDDHSFAIFKAFVDACKG